MGRKGCNCCGGCEVETLVNLSSTNETAVSALNPMQFQRPMTSKSYAINVQITAIETQPFAYPSYEGLEITDGKSTIRFTSNTDFESFINHNNWLQTWSHAGSALPLNVWFYYEVLEDVPGPVNHPTESGNLFDRVRIITVGDTNDYQHASTHTYSQGNAPTAPGQLSIDLPSTGSFDVLAIRYVSGVDNPECPKADGEHQRPWTFARWRCNQVLAQWHGYSEIVEELSTVGTGLYGNSNPPPDCCEVDISNLSRFETEGLVDVNQSKLAGIGHTNGSRQDPNTDADLLNEITNGPLDEWWYWQKWSSYQWQVFGADHSFDFDCKLSGYRRRPDFGSSSCGYIEDPVSGSSSSSVNLLPGQAVRLGNNGVCPSYSSTTGLSLSITPATDDGELDNGFTPVLVNEVVNGVSTIGTTEYPSSRTQTSTLADASTSSSNDFRNYTACQGDNRSSTDSRPEWSCSGTITRSFDQDSTP